jgi:phage portal protein BeeE
LAIATEEYGAKFFANGAAPAGVLEHPARSKTRCASGKLELGVSR